VHNPDRVYYGRLPGFGLSRQGVRQIEAAAAELSQYPVEAVYSSPLQRARESAQGIAARLGLEVRHTDLLLEGYTPFDGQPLEVVAGRCWDVYSGTPPAYEQPGDILARMQQFLARVRREHPGQHTVAVTHADLIAFAMLWSLGEPITPGQKDKLYGRYLSCGSITSFAFASGDAGEIPSFRYNLPQSSS
jgi:broad specificity phosphatase PhoE